MGASLEFRAGSVPVKLHPSFLLTALILGGVGVQDTGTVAVWVVVVTLSVLVHEAGHAAVFAAFGVPSRIDLQALGGVTRPLGGPALTHARWLAVSLAGPVSGLALGAATFVTVRAAGGTAPDSTADIAVRVILFANVGWSLVNLLPISPLDGGHALEAVLAMMGRRNAEGVAQVISLVTIIAVGVVSVGHGYPLVVIVLGYFWIGSAMSWWRRRDQQRDRAVEPLLASAVERLRGGDAAGAELEARAALAQVRSPAGRAAAARALALAAVLGNRPQAALDALGAMGAQPAVEDALMGALLAVAGQPESAVPYLYRAYAASPGDEAGATLARVLVAAGRVDEALSLVSGPQAIHLGPATDLALLDALSGPDLAPLRSSAAYAPALARIRERRGVVDRPGPGP